MVSISRAIRSLGVAALLVSAAPVAALEWSDTSIGWRYGTSFREPFIAPDIKKNILSLTHANGWKYGSNFVNADFLFSDKNDPEDCTGGVCTGKAQEVYFIYRGTLSLNKISGKDYKVGVVRDWGLTFGVDLNKKDDAGYNSRKRMFALGPRMMFAVPGFFDVGLYALWESNAPCSTFPGGTCTSRYHYDVHPVLDLTWGIPFGESGFSFNGYANFIASKGRDEFGAQTAAETHIDAALMYDIGRAVGGPKAKYKLGLGYEWWKNKFGNNHNGPAGSGAFAKTPMIRAEFHF